MTYVDRYIINNKKRNLFTIIGICLSTVLLISVGIIFSSLRDFLINNVKNEIGGYHVIIKGKVSNYNFILNKKYKNERYYITYKNIYRVYKNTDKICINDKCEAITYNDSLLSLYGISKSENILSVFKKFVYFLVFILSIIVFFIIYNSFKAGLNIRSGDVIYFKLIGMNNSDLYKLFLKEAFVIGLIGIIFGFLLALVLNFLIISILNNTLYEIFKGNLFLRLYFPFIFMPFLFESLIVFFSSLLPLKKIKNLKPMELFRKKDNLDKTKVKLFNKFVLWLTCINYWRSKNKYKSLIICIFIFTVSVNIFSLVLSYGLECIDKYLIVPEYDLKVSFNGNEEELYKIAHKLKARKQNIFKSCEAYSKINREYFLNDYSNDVKILVTDIGGNKIINKVDRVIQSNNRLRRANYNRFQNLNEILFDDEVKISNLSLTNNIPFGLKSESSVIVNLNEDDFNKVCKEYVSNLYLNTNYKGIDNYFNKIIKKNKYDMVYINIKKSREIINNLIIIFKLFLYGILILIFMVMTSSIINTVFISMNSRRRELSTLQSIGLDVKKINISLFLESLIISFKGWFYSIPFIFIVNKYLYSGIKEVFYFNGIILNLHILFLSLLLSFISVYLVMRLSYRNIRKRSLISNIKYNF